MNKSSDSRRLADTDASLIRQYAALLAAEDVTLAITQDGIDASERSGDTVTVDAAIVARELGEIAGNRDLSRYII